MRFGGYEVLEKKSTHRFPQSAYSTTCLVPILELLKEFYEKNRLLDELAVDLSLSIVHANDFGDFFHFGRVAKQKYL